MTRPAVVIGLGGTGQWVLTYLKKDLLELNNGKMPDNVRLLAFDTVAEAEAGTHVVGPLSPEQERYEKSPKRIGTVQLEKDKELVHIGGDVYPLLDGIRSGRFPQLGWFDADYWERNITRDNWILDRGAGRFRQFGLLAVYKDLMGGVVRSEILKRLPAAIKEVLATVEEGSFEVIVVSSVAGGTGSAMLVPFGVLARKFSGHLPVRTRAIVVLPTAFIPGGSSEELELRGGAALRELARSMMVPEGYKSRITFVPGLRDLENIEFSRPFDGIYFIDGLRDGQPLTKDPKYGVFPAASAWIRQILDDKSGQWFTNYVATNRAGAQMNDPRRMAEGVFGIFGVYSLYTPERTLRQTYRLKLAQHVIEELVDPQPLGPGGRLVPNPLPRGMRDAPSRALDFLLQTAKFGEEQQPVTQLFSEIGRIVQAGGKAKAEELDQKAQAGCVRRRRGKKGAPEFSWESALLSLPQGGRFDELNQEIQIELDTSDFYRRFPPSNMRKPPEDPGSNKVFIELTRGIKDFVREHYGGMGADGKDDYGKFGQAAKRAANAQIELFRSALRLNVNQVLAENGGRGMLGYAISVLRALEKHFDVFLEFMEEVERKRGSLAPRSALVQKLQKAREQWKKFYRTPPSLIEKLQRKPSGKALAVERAYLNAYAQLLSCVREEVLHDAVYSSANAMKSYIVETRRELERWAAALLEGDRARDIGGMLSNISQDLDRVITTIQEDKRSEEIERLVQVEKRESEIHTDDVEWALEGIRWDSIADKSSLRFSLRLHPQGVEGGELEVPREDAARAIRRQVERMNLEIFGRVMEQRFGQVEHVSKILDWCVDNYAPEELAKELADETTPLTYLMPNAQPGMEAFFISVDKERDPTGFTQRLETQSRIRIAGGEKPDNNRPVEVIDSEDQYRLTAVRTQVGLVLDDFVTWEVCKRAYEDKISKVEEATAESLREVVQTLQAQFTQKEEKEAVALEIRWRAEGRGYRVLHPRFVALLGRRRRLDAALQAWALGWVKNVRDEEFPDKYHWELRIPGGEPFWLTPNKGADELGSFEATESFVLVGKDHARGRKGVGLKWNALAETLKAQWQVGGDESSPMCAAVRNALAEGGLVEQWVTMAGREVDPNTDQEIFKDPVYRDLADYAEHYFRGMKC